ISRCGNDLAASVRPPRGSRGRPGRAGRAADPESWRGQGGRRRGGGVGWKAASVGWVVLRGGGSPAGGWWRLRCSWSAPGLFRGRGRTAGRRRLFLRSVVDEGRAQHGHGLAGEADAVIGHADADEAAAGGGLVAEQFVLAEAFPPEGREGAVC